MYATRRESLLAVSGSRLLTLLACNRGMLGSRVSKEGKDALKMCLLFLEADGIPVCVPAVLIAMETTSIEGWRG